MPLEPVVPDVPDVPDVPEVVDSPLTEITLGPIVTWSRNLIFAI